MVGIKQLCKSNDSIQRRSQLMAHIEQEGILQLLFLKCFLRFLFQFELNIGHFRFIAEDAEIVRNFTFFIRNGHHVEEQIDVSAILVFQNGMQAMRNAGIRLAVHAHQ